MQAAAWQFFFGEFSCVSVYIGVVESASDDFCIEYTIIRRAIKLKLDVLFYPILASKICRYITRFQDKELVHTDLYVSGSGYVCR